MTIVQALQEPRGMYFGCCVFASTFGLVELLLRWRVWTASLITPSAKKSYLNVVDGPTNAGTSI